MSIRIKMMLAILMAVVVTLAGVTVTVSKKLQTALTENFAVTSQAQLDRVSAFVDNFFDRTMSDIRFMASMSQVRENLGNMTVYKDLGVDVKPVGLELPPKERELFQLFSSWQANNPWYLLVYLGDSLGGFVQAPDDPLSAGYDPAARPWFAEAQRAGKAVVTEAYISDTGTVVSTVAVPVTGSNGVKGVLGIDISLESLTKELGRIRIGKTGSILLLDHTGQVLVAQDNSWLGKPLAELPAEAGTVLGALRAQRQGVSEAVLGGTTWLAGVHTTTDNWTLIMMQDKDEIFADAMALTLSIFIVGLGILVAMAAVAYVLSKSIVGPVEVLASAARSVAEGNLDAIPAEGKGFTAELGLLHRSLQGMVTKLAALIEEGKGKVREAEDALEQARRSTAEAEEAKIAGEKARREGILETAEQLSAVVQQITGAAGQLSGEVTATAESVATQQHRVGEIAAAISQMTVVLTEMADNISSTSALADAARAQTVDGKKLVHDMVASIAQVEKESIVMGKSLEALGTQAKGIGEIMGVINDIADQTNLLALNAAIEAARAGEAGRGFAVVADEVRKLAEKTMQATQQVGSAITSIQRGTDESLRAMQTSSGIVSHSAELAGQAGAALDSIEGMVDKTADQVRTIAAATEEQSATAEEVNNSTGAVSHAADSVSSAALRSSEAVAALLGLAKHLESIINNLRK